MGNTSTKEQSRVDVVLDSGDVVSQPCSFRACPLGMQFYTCNDVAQYRVLNLEIDIPGPNGSSEKLACTGVVVLSRFDDDYSMYRVWLIYIDLDDDVRNMLTCTSKENNLLCPHCMNY